MPLWMPPPNCRMQYMPRWHSYASSGKMVRWTALSVFYEEIQCQTSVIPGPIPYLTKTFKNMPRIRQQTNAFCHYLAMYRQILFNSWYFETDAKYTMLKASLSGMVSVKLLHKWAAKSTSAHTKLLLLIQNCMLQILYSMDIYSLQKWLPNH